MMKAVIFDFDGVLADTFDLNLEVCRIFDPNLSVEDFKEHHNFSWEGSSMIDIDGDGVEDFIEEQRERLNGEHLFPVEELIERLEKSHLLFIISNSSQRNINELLSQEGLDKYFEDILGPKVSVSKAEKIQMILKEYDLEPGECVLITDTLGDIREAKETSIKTIAVTWGYHEEEKLARGDPDRILEDFDELPKVIKDL